MKIKKLFPFAIVLAIMLSLLGCGTGADSNTPSPQNNSSNNSSSTNSLSSKSEYEIINAELDNFKSVLEEVTVTIELYHSLDFSSKEEMKEYKAKWQSLSDEAKAIQDTFLAASPSSEYSSDWAGFATCMGELANALSLGGNFKKYTAEEVASVIHEIGPAIVDISNEACIYAENILEISERTSTSKPSSNNNSPSYNTNNNGNVCVSCGKSASDSFVNPFSGEAEYYCYAHYQEMVNILGGMEEDVGQSGLTPRCQQCSKAGTYEIIGLSGDVEYYCYNHYKEMAEIIDYFLNG